MTRRTNHRKGLFKYTRIDEIEILRFAGIAVYKRVGVVHWCLGYKWVNA